MNLNAQEWAVMMGVGVGFLLGFACTLLAFRVQDKDPAACSARFFGGIVGMVVSVIVALTWFVIARGRGNPPLAATLPQVAYAAIVFAAVLVVGSRLALRFWRLQEVFRYVGKSPPISLELSWVAASAVTVIAMSITLGALALVVALAMHWV